MKIKKFVGICIALLYGFLVIAEQPQKSKPGIDVSLMDLTVKPCVDFYQYANGSWLKQARIPGENSLWGMVNEVVLRHQRTLSHILKEIVERSDWPNGSIQQKISDFYASGMDEEAIEKEGLKALDSSLKRIQNIRTIKDLIIEIGHLHAENIFPCFSFYLAIDEKHASSYICQLDEGGLALSRDDYLKEDDLSRQLRKNYLNHVAHIFELVGDSAKTAENNAKAVIIIETELAKVSMTNVEKREPLALYNKMSREQLMNMAPVILWESYFDTLGIQSSESHFQVSNPKFFQKLSAVLKSISLDDWQIYLRWHLIHNLAPFLHSSIVNEDFHFFQTILNGTQEILPRRKRVNRSLREALGMAIGQIYVKKVFSLKAKKKVEEMARNIRAVLRERIKKLEWMTASTKQHALKKLDEMVIKIGYPDKWMDYSKLDINRKSYVSNVRRARAFEFKWQMDLLGKPVDRTKWWMTPDQIGARYLSGLNSICVPAGILQPPFFNQEADDACNYGAIGTIIGHEITHGFDDSGRHYDAAGNLKDWWTPEDAKAYKLRTKPFIEQYESYKPLPDKCVNGKLTLGENIADLGGLKIAFLAFKKSLSNKPKPDDIDGFSAEQRFFISFAQLYRRLYRPERLRRLLENDPHSPNQYRVNGPISNFPEFYEYFGCRKNDPLWSKLKPGPEIW